VVELLYTRGRGFWTGDTGGSREDGRKGSRKEGVFFSFKIKTSMGIRLLHSLPHILSLPLSKWC
jgi:hypothetical protein